MMYQQLSSAKVDDDGVEIDEKEYDYYVDCTFTDVQDLLIPGPAKQVLGGINTCYNDFS